MAPGPPTVSIVIPAYNEEETIRDCLLAAVGQTVPAHEIIVVDNLWTDRTAEIVESLVGQFPEAPILLYRQSAVQGLVPTRDFGLDVATGDVLGRIDADTVIEPAWVEQVTRIFGDAAVAASTGPMIY
jgi:glycosyltransferase involved in cell wall biosynthesis